jgi:hypothetical protein
MSVVDTENCRQNTIVERIGEQKMTTLDLLQQQLKALYHPTANSVEEVEVPPLPVLALDGRGNPASPEHFAAAGTLSNLAYTIKFLLEQQHKVLEYTVMPLEGLWWTGDNSDWHQAPASNRFWRLLIVQPEEVTRELVEQARKIVEQQKPDPRLAEVRFEMLHEGRSAQVLHIGPYADEVRTVQRIFAWIKENGGTKIGTHHEIYLDDAGRTPPQRLRTILRYPFS